LTRESNHSLATA